MESSIHLVKIVVSGLLVVELLVLMKIGTSMSQEAHGVSQILSRKSLSNIVKKLKI